jgi:DNA polymerase-1
VALLRARAGMRQSEAVGRVAVVLAVDGNSLVHRAYHAAAGSASSLSAAAEPVWAVRGLITQIVAAVERVDADAVVVGFDDPDYSVRRERWPHYKVQRTDKAQCLVDQLRLACERLRELGVAVVVPPGFEADDVLASVSAKARSCGARTVIMTSDRDSFALIDDNTSVLRIINGGVEASPLLTEARLPLLLGISGAQYRDFAALRGDSSDNLPGVRGIGPKTASKLLMALGSARAAFDDLAHGGERVVAAIGAAAARKLAAPEARAAWEVNCDVMAVHNDVAPELDLVPGNPGVLPLEAERVRAVYASLGLIYSVSTALRVLADAPDAGDTGDRTIDLVAAEAREPVETVPATGWVPRPQRFPRLPARPAIEQLSLFA